MRFCHPHCTPASQTRTSDAYLHWIQLALSSIVDMVPKDNRSSDRNGDPASLVPTLTEKPLGNGPRSRFAYAMSQLPIMPSNLGR